MKNFKKRIFGYSLIELVLVVGLMSLFAVISGPGIKKYTARKNLEQGVEQIAQAINQAKTLAAAPDSSVATSEIVSGGYRIDFDKLAGSQRQELLIERISDFNNYVDGVDLQKEYLPTDVKINSIDFLDANGVSILPSTTKLQMVGVQFKYGLLNIDSHEINCILQEEGSTTKYKYPSVPPIVRVVLENTDIGKKKIINFSTSSGTIGVSDG